MQVELAFTSGHHSEKIEEPPSIYSIDGDADVMITYEAVKKDVFHVEWQ